MAGPIPVTVNITATGTSPSRKNFGTPLVLAYHTHFTDKVRIYTSLSGMITDGFSTTEPGYLLAQACFQQNPTVPESSVGRGTTAVQQTFTFTVTASSEPASTAHATALGPPREDAVGLSILDPERHRARPLRHALKRDDQPGCHCACGRHRRSLWRVELDGLGRGHHNHHHHGGQYLVSVANAPR